MVLTELLQNATEHAFDGGPGHVEVTAERADGRLELAVTDDGRGLPEGFDPGRSPSLGLSIVRALVESELGGSMTIGPAGDDGSAVGVRVRVILPLPDQSRTSG
jgi:two-component sensor histidine kinase